MRLNIFIEGNKRVISSDSYSLRKIKKELDIIIKNDISYGKDIKEKGYVLYSVKHITKNGIFYELYLYYIPKFWDLRSIKITNNIIKKESEDLLIEKINEFIIKIKELKKSNNIRANSFKNGKKDIIFFEIEYDYFILKKIEKILQKKINNKEKEIIYSDFVVGELNKEINKLNNDKNIHAQNIYLNNKKLYYLINSYLYSKFDKKYLKFLKEGVKSVNPIFKDMIKTLKRVKERTEYIKEKNFIKKDSLKRILNQSNYERIYNRNKSLFNNLNLLLKNKSNISKSKHYRKVFFMDKVWEIYVEENFNYYGEVSEKQKEGKFLEGSNPSDSRYSRPDLVTTKAVIDAKYKALNFKNGLIKNIDMNDINKLLRDVIFHRKSKGVLVFPMVRDITKAEDKEYKIYKYKGNKGFNGKSLIIIELKL